MNQSESIQFDVSWDQRIQLILMSGSVYRDANERRELRDLFDVQRKVMLAGGGGVKAVPMPAEMLGSGNMTWDKKRLPCFGRFPAPSALTTSLLCQELLSDDDPVHRA
jgi:hypothetical protein